MLIYIYIKKTISVDIDYIYYVKKAILVDLYTYQVMSSTYTQSQLRTIPLISPFV